jgi:hypothetical protein
MVGQSEAVILVLGGLVGTIVYIIIGLNMPKI